MYIYIYIKNRVIERVWHEINQRVIYQLKAMLVEFELNSLFDLDDSLQKYFLFSFGTLILYSMV